MSIVFNYGGGRQTVAMCILIAKGVLPKPDLIVMADTSWENQSTWDYLQNYTQPLLESLGLRVEIAPSSLATAGMYDNQGLTRIPAFTATGKLSGYCSNEWKVRVIDRYLRSKGLAEGTRWLGLAHDEKRRWKDKHNRKDGKWLIQCPLVDLMLNTDACLSIIEKQGWPLPITSSCIMCPHKRNTQWRHLRDNYPEQFEQACRIDEEIREFDEEGSVWVHHSRVPLREANIDADEPKQAERQCSLGMCFI